LRSPLPTPPPLNNDRHMTHPALTRGRGVFCFGGVGKAGRLDGGMTAHTAWTPWLCPHAWGLCRRMGALRHAKGRACTRGVWVGPVSFLDGMRRADVVSGRGRKTISRHADFAAMPACVGLC